MVNISETEKNILRSLTEKPRTYYSLWKHEKVAKSNKTVLETLEKMVNKQLIKKGSTEKGRKKHPYGLTLFGVLVGYEKDVLTAEHIPSIVETFKETIPLVFGEWDYFKKRGVEKIATKHLINTLKGCEAVHKQALDGWKKYMQKKNHRKTRLESAYSNNEWLTKEGVAQKINDVFLFEGLHPNVKRNFFVEHNLFIDNLTDEEEKILIDAIEGNEKLRASRAETTSGRLVRLEREMAEIRAALNHRFDLEKYRK